MAGTIGGIIGAALIPFFVIAAIAVSIYKEPKDATMTVITIVVLTVLSGFVISFIPSILAGILALLSFKAMGKKINSKKNPKVDKENNG